MEFAARRREREPVAYILGTKGFRSIELAVDPRVLIPRPETEHLVEAVLDLPQGARVCDVGTGSGAIALALKSERPDLDVVATDASADALEVARANAARLGLDVEFHHGDLLADVAGPLDAVVSNPPYVEDGAELAPEIVRYEPALALRAGPDGLDVIRRLLPAAGATAARTVALEIGAGQADAVRGADARGGVPGGRRWSGPRRDRARAGRARREGGSAGGAGVGECPASRRDLDPTPRCPPFSDPRMTDRPRSSDDRAGGVAVFPADTVYGLACAPDSPHAVERLYALKGRPPDKPAAVMFFDRDRALAALPELGERTRAALEALLPGAVTLLLPNPRRRFPLACGPDPATLGLRVPALPALAGGHRARPPELGQPRRRRRRAPARRRAGGHPRAAPTSCSTAASCRARRRP